MTGLRYLVLKLNNQDKVVLNNRKTVTFNLDLSNDGLGEEVENDSL